MARLLANGEQYFTDNNGNPLAGGKVYFYIPSTTTPKDTWQDPDEGVTNTNPVILDAAGRAIIYGNGEYRQIVKDSTGNLIWDQLTSTSFTTEDGGVLWGGTSIGSADVQEITTTTSFDDLTGKIICFFAGFTNDSSTQLIINDLDPIPFVKDTNAGPSPLVGGEIVETNLICCMWDEENNVLHLINGVPVDLILRFLQVNRLSIGNAISPAALSANTNNWNPSGLTTSSNLRASSSMAVQLTGILAQSPGRVIFLDNVGSFNITLAVDDAGSSVGNRFLGPGNVTLRQNQSAVIKYDQPGGGWRIYALSPAAIVPMQGLSIENGSGDFDTLMTVTATQVPVVDVLGNAVMLFGINTTGDITALGANGLDVGTVAASTGYYIWLIYNQSTGTDAILFSLSATAPTMPSGYTFKARIGWCVTDSSSDLIRTKQRMNVGRYVITSDSLPEIITGAAGDVSTFVSTTVVGFLPATAPIITVLVQTNANNFTAVAANGNGTPFLGDAVCAVLGGSVSADILLESSSIYYACGAEGGKMLCIGWTDDIG